MEQKYKTKQIRPFIKSVVFIYNPISAHFQIRVLKMNDPRCRAAGGQPFYGCGIAGWFNSLFAFGGLNLVEVHTLLKTCRKRKPGGTKYE